MTFSPCEDKQQLLSAYDLFVQRVRKVARVDQWQLISKARRVATAKLTSFLPAPFNTRL